MFGMMLRRLTGFVFATLALAGADQAAAESGDRIGGAVTIVNTVFADFDKSQRMLTTGDNVRQDEVIEVTADSRGELKLDDDTKLALGPGSRLVLDKFVYDSDKKAGSIVLGLAKGAFRFITGVAAKPTYVINTPNASITVRGTVFDVFILPDDTVWLLLHEGAIEVTGSNSPCRVLDQPGRLVRISKDGVVGRAVDWSKLDGNGESAFESAFPFVEQPPSVDARPFMTKTAILASDLPEAPDQDCSNGAPPRGKVQKASIGPDDGDDASPPPKKKSARGRDYDEPVVTPRVRIKKARKNDYDEPKRKKTTKRDNENDKAAARAAAAVIIGIGVGAAIGGFGKKGGGGYKGGGNKGMGGGHSKY